MFNEFDNEENEVTSAVLGNIIEVVCACKGVLIVLKGERSWDVFKIVELSEIPLVIFGVVEKNCSVAENIIVEKLVVVGKMEIFWNVDTVSCWVVGNE